MIGTRAHGRSRVYRHYTCFTRARYDSARCHASRLDADAVEHAVITALAGFSRDQHDLIADAITAARTRHPTAQDSKRAELAADRARAGQNRRGDRPVPDRVRERHPRPRRPRRTARPAQSPVSTAARPPRRSRRAPRRSTHRAVDRRLAAGRRSHQRHRRIRQPQPAQGPHRGAHCSDQDHRA